MYESDGESSDAKPKQSQSWEDAQKEEALFENILDVNEPDEDVCESPFQEYIYSHQEALPNDQERK